MHIYTDTGTTQLYKSCCTSIMACGIDGYTQQSLGTIIGLCFVETKSRWTEIQITALILTSTLPSRVEAFPPFQLR